MMLPRRLRERLSFYNPIFRTPYLLPCPWAMFVESMGIRPVLRQPYVSWCDDHMPGRWRALYVKHEANIFRRKRPVIEFMHEEDMVMFKLAFSEDMIPAPPSARRCVA